MTVLAQRPPSSAQSGIAAEIARSGCAGPVPILSPDQRAALSLHLDRRDLPEPFGWAKSRAMPDRVIYDVAARPDLIALPRPLLSEDIDLWGAQIVRRERGTSHPWHTDVESCAPDARVVSI